MNQPALAENQIARIHETFTRVPYARFLGLELGEIRSGEALIHLKVRDEFKQNQGVVPWRRHCLANRHGLGLCRHDGT